MEKIKDAIGLGATGREGQEPVSGEQGAGTATEPYDAGNREGTILHSAAKILKRQMRTK